MQNLKHIGRIKSTGAKVIVAFRTLPGESDHALVVATSSLSDDQHDAIIKTVESDRGQEVYEFGELMFTTPFPDGRGMLQALQAENKLVKVPTDNILMLPAPGTEIPLQELNVLIAEQKNCAVDELYTFVAGAPRKEAAKEEQGKDIGEPDTKVETLKAKENEALSDKDIAKSYRSQADAMYKEAARLRKEADAIDPPQKKTVVKAKEEASA